VAPRTPVEPPRNLVLLIEESLGAQFVGHLGDRRGLTPNLDALANEGLAFLQLYSNGTRSIRGLAAMSAGFLPLLGDGVLKRPRSQTGFFCLASLLEPHGYQTSFVYGGEARFDNMRGWYQGNGFDVVIEERDYENPTFRSTWGVSDEDLLLKANALFRTQHAQGRPFVSVVFTSSNHKPFELPEGRIEWVEGVPRASVENAIKYADHAVGRFFEVARAEPYFANTVFVIVADHNVKVQGDDLIPIHGFHIPGLILGPGIEPGRHAGLCSQPDLLATALGELGIDLRYPILGNSIHDPGREPFLMMQFNDTYGFRRGDQVAVLRVRQPAETFDLTEGRLHPAAHAIELELDALAWLTVTEDLYQQMLYR
jgi:phosphoglycerol transferase MdoB-like AlkP superfamily enzyme